MKKENCIKALKKRFLSAIVTSFLLIFVLPISVWIKPYLLMEVKASNTPKITSLSVGEVSGGISAKCSFTGYDKNTDYELQLYLIRVTVDGEEHVTYLDVLSTDSGEGSAETTPLQVEPGTYKASLVSCVTAENEQVVVNVKDSILYDVRKTETGYEVAPHGQGVENRTMVIDNEDVLEGVDSIPCVHDFEYVVFKAATPDADEILAHQCVNCGNVLDYMKVPNSAYAAFLQEACRQMENAEPNEQVVVKTGRWISFNQSVVDALTGRPDIELCVEYRYGGKRYEVSIPQGADVSQIIDENGYCGFLYLSQLFGCRECNTPAE